MAVLFISPLNNCLWKLVTMYKSDSFRHIRSSESCFCLISFVFCFFLPYFCLFSRCFRALELPKSACSESSSSVNRSWIFGAVVVVVVEEEEEGGGAEGRCCPAQRSIATEQPRRSWGSRVYLLKCIFKRTQGASLLTMTNDSTWSFFSPLY